ncbi:Protein of unknown function [Escherichia coli D6-113.11]|nr:Protein of unknown function [Escherichia coli D6-113.11]CDU35537.1 Protein of unknown function [Escherichia coli D6-113.11]
MIGSSRLCACSEIEEALGTYDAFLCRILCQ